MKKKGKQNSVKRSIARGNEARGMTGVNDNGRDAYKKSKQSTRGHYRVEFTKTFEGVTDKDVELRKVYGKDLVAASVGVPADMITFRAKKQTAGTSLTARDEVFYVKVGKDTYGKLSIRTQRLWKTTLLIFVFQVKKNAIKPPQKAFSRNIGFKKRTASQKAHASRKSYNSRRGGTR